MPIKDRTWIAHEHDAPYEYLQERRVAIFDTFNKLVYDNLNRFRKERGRWEHDGKPLTLRAVKIEGKYLVFGTFVSDQKIQEIFPTAEIFN